MKADPFVQLRLLELQSADAAIDRLAHRRKTLPELAELAGLAEQFAVLDAEQVDAETLLTDLARAQHKLEADIDLVRQRQARDETRMTSGAIGSSKELESLQGEITSLKRRQGVLEDEELELMQQSEDAQKRYDAATEELAVVEAAREAADARRIEAEAAIDVEVAAAKARRAELVPTLTADLLALYERQRAANGGVGAAALLRRRCEGCHLELAGSELQTVRSAPVDEVLRCENCGRVLIRTEESGL